MMYLNAFKKVANCDKRNEMFEDREHKQGAFHHC